MVFGRSIRSCTNREGFADVVDAICLSSGRVMGFRLGFRSLPGISFPSLF